MKKAGTLPGWALLVSLAALLGLLYASIAIPLVIAQRSAGSALDRAGQVALLEMFALLLLSVLPLAVRCRTVGVMAFTEPLCMMSASMLLYFVFRGVILQFRQTIAPLDRILRPNHATNADIALTLGYVLAGFCAFHAAYRFWNPPVSGARVWSAWSSIKVRRIVLWGTAIACASSLAALYAAGGIRNTLNNFGNLRVVTAGYGYALIGLEYWGIIFAFLWMDRLRNKRNLLAPLLLLVISNVCDAFIGNRIGVLATWTAAFLLWVFAMRTQKMLRTTLLLVCVLVACVGFALPMARARETAKSIHDVLQIGRKYWSSDAGGDVAVRVSDEFVALDSFAVIVGAGAASFPFRYGGTYLDGALFVVPRAIWPNKPKAFSYAVGEYIFGAPTDFPPGYMGELYVNFHVFGIVGGMYLLGLLLRKAYQWTLSGDPAALTVYSILIPYLIFFMGRSFIGGGTLTLILAGLLLPVMYYLRRRPVGETPPVPLAAPALPGTL